MFRLRALLPFRRITQQSFTVVVTYGTVKGVRGNSAVTGTSATGRVRGMKTTGSVKTLN